MDFKVFINLLSTFGAGDGSVVDDLALDDEEELCDLILLRASDAASDGIGGVPMLAPKV
tara:strand:+ start:485 stop:661 length:177 start_codon:yes stop_codon:yes gene_type:complete